MCAFAFDTKIKANAADTEPNYKHTSYLSAFGSKKQKERQTAASE